MTTPLVVDTSAVIDVLTGQPDGEGVRDMLLTEHAAVHAPAVLDLEIVSTARRLERAGHLSGDRARDLFEDLAALDIERHPLPPLTAMVWSTRQWARVADGYYVALAAALRVPLLTTDRRLARAVRDRGVVDVIGLGDTRTD